MSLALEQEEQVTQLTSKVSQVLRGADGRVAIEALIRNLVSAYVANADDDLNELIMGRVMYGLNAADDAHRDDPRRVQQ